MTMLFGHRIDGKPMKAAPVSAPTRFNVRRAGDEQIAETSPWQGRPTSTPEGLGGLEPLNLWHATGFAGGL